MTVLVMFLVLGVMLAVVITFVLGIDEQNKRRIGSDGRMLPMPVGGGDTGGGGGGGE